MEDEQGRRNQDSYNPLGGPEPDFARFEKQQPDFSVDNGGFANRMPIRTSNFPLSSEYDPVKIGQALPPSE